MYMHLYLQGPNSLLIIDILLEIIDVFYTCIMSLSMSARLFNIYFLLIYIVFQISTVIFLLLVSSSPTRHVCAPAVCWSLSPVPSPAPAPFSAPLSAPSPASAPSPDLFPTRHVCAPAVCWSVLSANFL